MSKLVTHSGSFHADDVFSYAILHKIDQFKNHSLTRTRDMNFIAQLGENDIVFDVGSQCNMINRLDHHMISSHPERQYRDNDVPYSAVGLIWKIYGHRYLEDNYPELDQDGLEYVWKSIDKHIIEHIDCIDNGYIKSFSSQDIVSLIDDFVPTTDNTTDADYDQAFLTAASFADDILTRRIHKHMYTWDCKKRVDIAITDREHKNIVILEQSMPWASVVFNHQDFDDIFYVISRVNDNEWIVKCVATSPEEEFSRKKDLPAHWAGLRDQELATVSGIDDAIFCHNALFIAGTRSKEGALKMAIEALAYTPENKLTFKL